MDTLRRIVDLFTLALEPLDYLSAFACFRRRFRFIDGLAHSIFRCSLPRTCIPKEGDLCRTPGAAFGSHGLSAAARGPYAVQHRNPRSVRYRTQAPRRATSRVDLMC